MRRPRRVLAVVAVAVAGLGACTGDGGGDTGDAGRTTASSSAGSTATSSSTSTTTSSTSTTTEPVPTGDGVGYDGDLLRRLPEVPGFDRSIVREDRPFLDVLCDGVDAPARPEGQAVGRYRDAADATLLVAAYRFEEPTDASAYAERYASSVRRCTTGEVPREVRRIGRGELFVADTQDGYGTMLVLVSADEMWVGYLQHPREPVVFPEEYVALLRASAEG